MQYIGLFLYEARINSDRLFEKLEQKLNFLVER